MCPEKILIVDDDAQFRKMLSMHLERNEFQVFEAQNGDEALRQVYKIRPDLIILDIMMPGISGLDVCKRIRELTNTPIIVLSAVTTEDVIIAAFEAGADDYVRKPYAANVLIARIQHKLRHTRALQPPASKLQVGDVVINLPRRSVAVRGQEVKLTPKEFELLRTLLMNRDKVLEHDYLLRKVWGAEYIGQLDYLRLYINYLRKKIEVDPSTPQIVKTMRGIGYYLDDSSQLH